VSVSLQTIRQYVETLSWIEGGILSADVLQIVDFLETKSDSSWLVSQTRLSVALLAHWQERLRFTIRSLEIVLSQRRDVLDQQVRESLKKSRRQTRMRYIEAGIAADADYSQQLDVLRQYELALGTLEGLSSAMDTSLIVQEAVAVRRQEVEDSQI